MARMADSVSIENKPFWARFFTVFWAIEAVMGLVFAALGFSWLGGQENGVAWVLIVIGLHARRGQRHDDGRVLARRPPQGHGHRDDRAGFPRPAAVADPDPVGRPLTWAVVFNGRSYSLQFDLTPEIRSRYRVSWGNRMAAAMNRAFRYPEFTVMTLGTGKGISQLDQLMRQFKPPRG